MAIVLSLVSKTHNSVTMRVDGLTHQIGQYDAIYCIFSDISGVYSPNEYYIEVLSGTDTFYEFTMNGIPSNQRFYFEGTMFSDNFATEEWFGILDVTTDKDDGIGINVPWRPIHDLLYAELLMLGETTFIGNFNDESDNISSIFFYGGRESLNSFDKLVVSYIDFQVMVRDTNYTAGYDRIEAIRKLFEHYSNGTITILNKSDIHGLGKDEKQRNLFSCNFSLKAVEGRLITVDITMDSFTIESSTKKLSLKPALLGNGATILRLEDESTDEVFTLLEIKAPPLADDEATLTLKCEDSYGNASYMDVSAMNYDDAKLFGLFLSEEGTRVNEPHDFVIQYKGDLAKQNYMFISYARQNVEFPRATTGNDVRRVRVGNGLNLQERSVSDSEDDMRSCILHNCYVSNMETNTYKAEDATKNSYKIEMGIGIKTYKYEGGAATWLEADWVEGSTLV